MQGKARAEKLSNKNVNKLFKHWSIGIFISSDQIADGEHDDF